MTSNREQLLAIDTEIKNITDKQAELSGEEYNLSNMRNDVIKNIIVEERPFQSTEWELLVSHQGQAYLNHLSGNEDGLKEIRDLCFRSWHDSFEMQDGIRLDFDDGKFSLHFDDPRQLSIFAQKQSLIIVAPDIEDKVRQLKRELATLEELRHQFNLKG